MSALAFIAVFGAWLGFANPVFQFPPAVLAFPLGLAWIGFRAISKRKAFLWGWLAGTLACAGCLYWMVIPVAIYGNLPWYVALPCPLLAGAALGLLYGLFSLGLHMAAQVNSRWHLIALAGLSWAAIETAMSVLFTGFPWITLSSAFAPWPLAIQGASLVGAFVLSGIFAALAVSILLYKTVPKATTIATSLIILLLGFGVWHMKKFQNDGQTVRISLAQGNVDQSLKWDPDYQKSTVNTYIQLSEKAAKEGAKLVVWPETAMPFYLQDRTPYGFIVRRFAQDHSIEILSGAPAYRVTDPKTRSYVLNNRAFLVQTNGSAATWYDKQHLVPFGEYMPFRQWIPFKQLVQAAGNFAPGKNNAPLMTADYVDFGVLICYEAIFPNLAQHQVELGAQFLVNISNDAWFGKTSAPRQHLALTTLRAVEQGRWLARCTNTGITAFIDPLGRIASRIPQFEKKQLTDTIRARRELTVFHLIQPWVGNGVLLLTFFAYVMVAVAKIRRKRHN